MPTTTDVLKAVFTGKQLKRPVRDKDSQNSRSKSTEKFEKIELTPEEIAKQKKVDRENKKLHKARLKKSEMLCFE